ncbi:Tcp11-domain-containing protein [Rickenella mellea]|uniref:Tcp11-domain-containing protein n=1 Tax=Rickenella mellea TaxID=50990 RepID=A0A4Y7PSM3_9AGAM|nr:Tcp11-domain-containing protein [Rickenella mellea]
MNDPAHESIDTVHTQQLQDRKRKSAAVDHTDHTNPLCSSPASSLSKPFDWQQLESSSASSVNVDEYHDYNVQDEATPRPKRPRIDTDVSRPQRAQPPPPPPTHFSKVIILARNRRACSHSKTPDIHLRTAREKLKSSGANPPRHVKFGPPSLSKCPASGPGPSEGSLSRHWNLNCLAGGLNLLHCAEHCHPFVPSVYPPITRDTLRELDLDAILRNPQLRHDLLFDAGLQFRPTTSRRKREATDTYWAAIKRELSTGCTCFSFDEKSRHVVPEKCICASAAARVPGPEVHAVLAVSDRTPAHGQGQGAGQGQGQGMVWTVRMPSRIRPLIVELLEVILSIILPTPSAPSSPSSPSSQSSSPTSSSSSPTSPISPSGCTPTPTCTSRRLTPEHLSQITLLRAGLDPDLIQQELQHNLFDPSGLFRALGEILKSHCAPMRDASIDAMVEMAQMCKPGSGGGVDEALGAFRMCFEVLEVMKLDVANHQLSALRPFLIESAPEFELKTFGERHDRGELSLSTTRAWLSSARTKHSSQPLSLPLSPSVPLPSRHTTQLTIATALTDLLFYPPSSPPTSLPPLPTTTPINKGLPSIVPLPGYPETLFLDHSRVLLLTADVGDLMAVYVLLMLYRQLVFTSTGGNGVGRPKIEESEVEKLKKEIWEVGPQRLGLCFCKGHELDASSSALAAEVVSSSSSATEEINSRHAGHKDKDAEKWRKGMRDVILQVAWRAELTRNGVPFASSPSSPSSPSSSSSPSASASADVDMDTTTPSPSSTSAHTTIAPSEQLIRLANGWCESHLREGSPLCGLLRKRLRDAVYESVVASLAGAGAAGFGGNVGVGARPRSKDAGGASTSTGTNGLDALSAEITHLGQRIAKLAALHMWVYGSFYEQKGFFS